MNWFWVASLQVWPRWALIVIRFVEKYFTCVKDPKNSGQSLVAALQSRPPLTLTINTIRDYVSMYMQLFTPLYVTSHHYDICTFEGTKVYSKHIWVRRLPVITPNNTLRRTYFQYHFPNSPSARYAAVAPNFYKNTKEEGISFVPSQTTNV